MKKLNKKGFTLVELLAVIVILALLMVVATSSIGGAMSNAKKNALKTEAQKMLTSAYQDMKSSFMLSNNIANVSGEKKDAATAGNTILKYSDGTKYEAYFEINSSNQIITYCVRDADNKLSLSKTGLTISVDNSDTSATPTVPNDITIKNTAATMCNYDATSKKITNLS